MKIENLVKKYGETDFITGMRAYAALAVVLIHSGGGGLRELGSFGNFLADLGRTGVYVFFVISGYSVSVSYKKSRSYVIFLARRLFRLVPLYYFWLALVVFVVCPLFGTQQPSWYSIVMHVLFTSPLDYKIANSILGVEWSISIEVFWYLFVPFLVVFASSLKKALILVAGSLLFYFALHRHPELTPSVVPIDQKDVYLALHYSFLPYFFSFCLGVFAFFVREHYSFFSRYASFAFFAIPALTLVSLWGRFQAYEYVLISIATCFMIIVGDSQNFWFRIFLNSKPILFVGGISYGIYLAHPQLIFLLNELGAHECIGFLKFFYVVALSCVVSSLLRLYVEFPFEKLGKSLFRP